MPHHNALQSVIQNVRSISSRVGRVPLVLVTLWLLTVQWGEHLTFARHVRDCVWNSWETWEAASNPHHVLLIADPQLVDPHTYPDRPWPLSSLTIFYTDLYLKRSYRELLKQLQPESTLLLGDLFDGGREWGTRHYESPDKRYQQYGQEFWIQEYQRFQNMFIKTWADMGLSVLPADGGRRLIASLPGNHDLGFGGGINSHVKSRFEAHFGSLNRIDVLGNHSFISLDTVSLSAMDPISPPTSGGTGDVSASATENRKISRPVEDFLSNAKVLREQKVRQEIRRFGTRAPFPEIRKTATDFPSKYSHTVEALSSSLGSSLKRPENPLKVSTSQFPSIVLSHVPLWRDGTSDCGPLRERGKAIPISAGYQYQNVLTPLISRDIIEKLDASQIAMIYSGDDHDYCEIDHNEFTGRIKEITVKSMSWAMGVRRPGVQLVSLWNPVDFPTAMTSLEYSVPAPGEADKTLNMPRRTVQNHLCLLPDQLGIFATYGGLMAFTLAVLLVRALLWKPIFLTRQQDLENDEPLLPSWNDKHTQSSRIHHHRDDRDFNLSTPSSSSVTSRKDSQSGVYGEVLSVPRSRAASLSKDKLRFTQADSDDWGMPTNAHDRITYAKAHHDPSQMSQVRWAVYYLSNIWIFRSPMTRLESFTKSVVHIAVPVLGYYLILMREDL